MPVEASDRISTTTARLEDETKASTAEKINATGQALSSRPMKAASAGDCRIGSVARLSRLQRQQHQPDADQRRARRPAWLVDERR